MINCEITGVMQVKNLEVWREVEIREEQHNLGSLNSSAVSDVEVSKVSKFRNRLLLNCCVGFSCSF